MEPLNFIVCQKGMMYVITILSFVHGFMVSLKEGFRLGVVIFCLCMLEGVVIVKFLVPYLYRL